MNLFLNPFLPEKTHTDDSVSFHVAPTLDHGPIVCLRSFGVRQSICLKGFKVVADKDMRKMSNIVENLIRRHVESKV